MEFSYVKTGDTLSGTKRQDVLKVINEGGKTLRKRLEKRGIKIPEVVRARVSSHNQVVKGTDQIKSHAQKFYLTLKNGTKAIVNISESFNL